MNWTNTYLPYEQTGYFSHIVLDYIQQAETIKPFYKHPFSIDGIKDAIADRKKFNTDRPLLVKVLKDQYAKVQSFAAIEKNIDLLLNENTFTICTAHQPNIFTGPLYFIYKIFHAAKIASWLKQELPQYNFVPVYYMGSEDADLEELNHIYINGEKYEWGTRQTGAVGRMKVDKDLLKIIDQLTGQLSVEPFGYEIMALIKECYQENETIDQATFKLVNSLLGDYGVVVLLPDTAALKSSFGPVIEKELMHSFSHPIVEKTTASFLDNYKVQASGRELNMFYLNNNSRERIESNGEEWTVVNTDLEFSKSEILAELKNNPERFSPNVILRPVLQEWLLPNIAFIGGGGEIAYWLQLKDVFAEVNVPYPVLVVRNSFLLIPGSLDEIISKLKIPLPEIFKKTDVILSELVKRESGLQLSLEKELTELSRLYESMKAIAGKADISLQNHTEALYKQASKKITALEKKMLRAEKKKFEAGQRQLQNMKGRLFPVNNLQERIENMLPFYAKYGKAFLKMIYDQSAAEKQVFTVLTEQN